MIVHENAGSSLVFALATSQFEWLEDGVAIDQRQGWFDTWRLSNGYYAKQHYQKLQSGEAYHCGDEEVLYQ